MSRRWVTVFLLTALLTMAVCGACSAQHIIDGFAVRRTRTGHDIAFTLVKPTDVTVRILDAKGDVVRHLACGMVGFEEAAKPLVPHTLTQKITWDGKDDAGNPVDANGYKATLGVGLKATFDRFILGERDGFVLGARNPRDMIFKGRGDAYFVAQSFGIHADTCRVFDGRGKFVRALFPYGLDRPKVREFFDTPSPVFGPGRKRVRHDALDWDGDRVPVSVAHSDSYYLTPRVAQAVMTTDGHIIAALGYVAGYASLTRWTPGGLPTEHFWSVPWHAGISAPRNAPEETKRRWRDKDRWKLVAGTDGDFYLADGIHNIVAHFRASDFAPIPFTFSGTKKLDNPRCTIGELNTPGDDADHFNGPDGIALDAGGRILVLDGAVVKVYDRSGRFVETKPRAESAFDKVRVPIRDGGLNWGEILKREKDKPGSSGVPAELLASGGKPRTLSFPHFITVDSTGRLYLLQRGGPSHVVSDVDGKTFTPRRMTSPGLGYMCVDAEDNWYVSVQPGWSTRAELRKFSPDGKRLKFGDLDAIVPEDVGKRGSIKGVAVARNGDIHIVAAYRDFPKTIRRGKKPWAKGEAYLLCRVDVYSADGTLKKKGLVRSQALSDVAVDREGNVYVIEGKLRYKSRPKRTWPPPFLSPEEAKRYEGDVNVNKRKSLMQRLVKFPPEGGVLDGDGGPVQLWNHPGVSGVSPLQGWGHLQPGQMCLDADGRIWISDTYNYSMKAVDAAGNLVLRVGKYGSEACTGGGGDRKLEGTKIVVDPEIPLARPHGIAVWKDYLLIADMFAHRVMRCRLGYEARREIAITP